MNRYARQQQLPEIGAEGQRLLRAARVLVLGCGALGSLAAMYLAGAGVGELVIADFDCVDITNLHRQLFYTEAEAGRSKARLLADRIAALNSEVKVTVVAEFVRPERMSELAAAVDLVVEAADNPDTKTMVSDACQALCRPCVIGGVEGWRGQVLTCLPGSPNYRAVFGAGADAGFTPCSLGGVAGPARSGGVTTGPGGCQGHHRQRWRPRPTPPLRCSDDAFHHFRPLNRQKNPIG